MKSRKIPSIRVRRCCYFTEIICQDHGLYLHIEIQETTVYGADLSRWQRIECRQRIILVMCSRIAFFRNENSTTILYRAEKRKGFIHLRKVLVFILLHSIYMYNTNDVYGRTAKFFTKEIANKSLWCLIMAWLLLKLSTSVILQ